MMRRLDLVLSQEESLAIVDGNQYAVLCLTDPEGRPYGLPMDYVREDNSLYFHGSKEGRKVSSMKATPWVCAVIIGENEIIPSRFGRKYKTVIVEGGVELIDDPELKRQVMTWVVKRKSPDYFEKGLTVIERMLDRVLVYKMDMALVSGKHGL